jgi:hypothetical protein
VLLACYWIDLAVRDGYYVTSTSCFVSSESLEQLSSLHKVYPSSQHILDRKLAKETKKTSLSNDQLTHLHRRRIKNQYGRQRSSRRQKSGPQEAQQQSRPRQRAHKERHVHSHKDRSWQSRCWRKRCSKIRYAREESSRLGRFCFFCCKGYCSACCETCSLGYWFQEANPECSDSFD